MFGSKQKETSEGIVALFNASDDTIDMVQTILKEGDEAQTLVWCHFADLKKGIVDFAKYVDKHNPEVVIFDISPPYDANWTFLRLVRNLEPVKGRQFVITTTNKPALDKLVGETEALEIIGKPYDLLQVVEAVRSALAQDGDSIAP